MTGSTEVSFLEKYKVTKQHVDELARARGHLPVTLIVVTKNQTAEKIRKLYEVGHRDFGENYLQEFEVKAEVLSDLPEIRWHFIGQLQTNKLKKIAILSSYVHAVHKLKHLQKLDSLGHKHLQYFLNVNLNKEPQKQGLQLEAVTEFYKQALKFKSLRCIGLMAIPKKQTSSEQQKQIYTDFVKVAAGLDLTVSLGMSDDYELAIQAGSQFVRIGSKIFQKEPSF